ncbi:MAG: DMT family transporter, partial [Spirochaetales bacterium]|nr:DMT family transporter [Spirochaetales bacterium]
MTERTPLRTLLIDLVLFSTAVIWGLAFVAQRMGMDHLGPFMFNGIRFALGAVSLVPLILVRRAARRQKNAQPASGLRILFTGGTISGLCLFLGSSFQQMGIVYTTAGNAGFVTGLYVVFVPFIGRFFGHRSSRGRMLAILFSTAGLYLLSVNEQFRIHPGDALVVVSAVFWALHMLSIAWFARRTDPLVLSFLQFSVCS